MHSYSSKDNYVVNLTVIGNNDIINSTYKEIRVQQIHQPQEIWNKTFAGHGYEKAYSIRQTSDGGYIIAGETLAFGMAYCGVWLVKTDAYGNMQWKETLGGSGDDTAMCIILNSDDGYVIAGDKESYGPQRNDLWLIKLGDISAESDKEYILSDEEQTHIEKQPEQTTSLPGYNAVLVCVSILFAVIKILQKRK